MNAIDHVLPKSEHRCCTKQLYANWRKKYKNKELQKQFWLCTKSNNMSKFEANMEKGFKGMLNYLLRHWCRVYFNTEVKCDIVDDNLVEAFNV